MKGFDRSSKVILLVLLLAAIAIGEWLAHSHHTINQRVDSGTPTSANASVAQVVPPRSRLAAPVHSNLGPVGSSHVPDRPRVAADKILPLQKAAAEKDPQLQVAASSLRSYRLAFNQNPVGNNAEITRLLLGDNTRSLRFLPGEARLNQKGELIDRWDQPLFFHQISATNLEVRSAGPDQIMWTEDDEVLH